jgi:hypothetical protein
LNPTKLCTNPANPVREAEFFKRRKLGDGSHTAGEESPGDLWKSLGPDPKL